MRKISAAEAFAFACLLTLALLLAAATIALSVFRWRLGDFRGIALVASAIFLVYFYGIIVYRLFVRACPLAEGEIEPGSREQSIYHVYILFYLILFYPVIRSGLLPTPLMRLFYLALGTRLGANTYSQGIIHDPPFVTIGNDCVVGQSSLLIPHVIEGNRLAHHAIVIGDRVTVGAGAIVLCDVIVKDDAVIAAGAVVSKGSRIEAGETWGGIPARCIRRTSTA